MFLETGNIVAADGRLIDAANLRVQEAALTGESQPVDKDPATIVVSDDRPTVVVGDRRNMVFMGTAVSYGHGHAVVTDTGMRTQLGAIATMLQAVRHEPTPLQRRLDHLGRRLALAALAIVAVMFVLGLARGEGLRVMFLTAVSMAVAAVPEGLPAVVTIALALGAPADAAPTRPHPKARGRRDTRFCDRHLLRQNRHAHGEPHAGRDLGCCGAARGPW